MEMYLEMFATTLSLIDTMVNQVFKYASNREKKTKILQCTIYNQRNLKYVCKGDYDIGYFLDYENKVCDFLKSFFEEEIYNSFIDNNIDIMWTLRSGSKVKDEIIENSLEEFIKECNKKKYKVQ